MSRPRIRHLAIASDDPRKAGAFYRAAFGWREVGRFGFDASDPADALAPAPRGSGVILTDGAMNVTIIRFSTDQLGHGLDYTGLHHIGFQVGDYQAYAEKLAALGVPVMMEGHQIAPGTHVELKYRGPDNVVFDIAQTAWKAGDAPDACARVRHFAIASDHPGRAAGFFKSVFGLTELRRFGLDPAGLDDASDAPRPSGVLLSDGSTNVTLLKLPGDQLGRGIGYTGLHHFGVIVADVAAMTRRLEALGAPPFMTGAEVARTANAELKFRGPEGVVFDIAETPWEGSAPLNASSTRTQESA